MDHHCGWTNNCIGLLNRKSFNLILVWGSLAMMFASFIGLSYVNSLYTDIFVY